MLVVYRQNLRQRLGLASNFAIKDDLELLMLLSSFPQCWGYRDRPPFNQCWESSPRLPECRASTLPTELRPLKDALRMFVGKSSEDFHY